MKTFKSILVVTFAFFIGTAVHSKVVVTKVSKSGKRLLLNISNEDLERGQKLVLVYKGQRAGLARVLKVSGRGNKAIAQLTRGKAVRGLVAMDEYDYDTQKKVASSRKDPWEETEDELYDEFDDDYSSKKSRRNRNPAQYGGGHSLHKGFVSALLGYDLEMNSEFVNGGLSFGLQGAYKLDDEWGVGARFHYTNGTLSGDLNKLNPPGFGKIDESLRIISFMIDALYFLQPNFFVGPSLGYTQVSCSSCNNSGSNSTSEGGLALGGTLGYDYMLTDEFAVGGRANLAYYMVSDDVGLIENAVVISFLVNGSYWF